MANADEAARQDVLDEAPEKLHGSERHRARLTVVRVVLPLKRDALAVEGAEPVIGDGDAMRVPSEVAQHGADAAEGGLGIDDPVGLKEGVDKGVPLRRLAQALRGTREVEHLPVVRAPERLDKLAPKDPAQDLHG